MMVFAVILVVSAALIVGALWGVYGKLPYWLQGNLLALAGGSLILSVVLEMIQPAVADDGFWIAIGATLAGAVTFSGVDYLIDEKMDSEGGGGLLAAITLDGVRDNLSLGVSLIGGNVLQASALAGSILLSNLPEAAGGAKHMLASGIGKTKIMLMWTGAAVLLAAAALAGKWLLSDVPKPLLHAIDCFAAGAVIASLATEVFPQAFKDSNHWAGISTAIGLVLALGLMQIGG